MRGITGRGLAVVAVLAVAAMWPAAGVSAGGSGCYGGATQGEGDTVAIRDFCFTPNVLRTDPGAEVTFVNRDPIYHNVSAMDWGWFDKLGKGDTFTATFDDPGIYPFACTYHPGMTGAIVVGDGTGAGSGIVSTSGLQHPAEKAVGTAPAASRTAAASSPAAGWAVSAGVGLLVGAAGVGLLRKRRQQA